MEAPLISVIMDGIVIVLLATTVFFAARLSHHLKNFKQGRQEMNKLVATLTSQIDAAQRAVDGLRENAKQSGKDVQLIINEARALSDELQLMINAGDNLASRLEKGAGAIARPVTTEPLVKFDPNELPARKNKAIENSWRVDAQAEPRGPGFAIRDPEFDRSDDDEAQDSGDDDFSFDEFASRAEKELFEALQGKKKSSDIGGH